MSRYRRFFIPGGTCFFTVTLADRSSESLVRNVDLLRRAYGSVQQQRPFRTIAICILPDHLHAIWTLPEGDADFPRRWSLIKGRFARALPATALRTQSKLVGERKASGSADTGSTRSGMTTTCRATSTTHTTIRSAMGS